MWPSDFAQWLVHFYQPLTEEQEGFIILLSVISWYSLLAVPVIAIVAFFYKGE